MTKYSESQIRKAFELGNIPTDFADNVIQLLPEAVEQLRFVQPETLEDLFEWFCNEYDICEEHIKGKKRKHELVELRFKFAKLAVKTFGKKATQAKIGKVLEKNHATVLWYLNKYVCD